MKSIPCLMDGDILQPASNLANHSGVIRWVCNGESYLGYEADDVIPSEHQPPPQDT